MLHFILFIASLNLVWIYFSQLPFLDSVVVFLMAPEV